MRVRGHQGPRTLSFRGLSLQSAASLSSRDPRRGAEPTMSQQPSGTRTPVLSLRGISKNFGAVSALTDIDMDVHAGEVVALVGDNGAGKSTLVKTLAGVHQPSSGTIMFDGKPVTISTPGVALNLGIATVFQDLALCENLDVVANIFLG